MKRIVKTIRLPEVILDEVRPHLDTTGMNFTGFVIEALKNYVRVLNFEDGVNSSFGAWEDNRHPELGNDEDIHEHVRNLRKSREF